MKVTGKVFKYGDNVDTDVIIPARYLNTADHKELASHCMEDIDKDFDNMLPGIKWELISGTVTDLLKVEVTEADLNAQANALARQQLQQYGMYNMDDETIADMAKRILNDKQIRQRIHSQVEEIKLFNSVRDAITLEEKHVSLDEFKKLANPQEND